MMLPDRARACRLSSAGRLSLLLLVLAAPLARAQDAPPQGEFGRITTTEATTGPYYYFTQRGAPTVRVELWGAVALTGLYEVEAGTDLRTLLTLASGPNFSFTPTLKQRIEVVITRGPDGARETFDPIDVLDVAGNENPVLEDGDTVFVRSQSRTALTYREIITTAAVVIGLILSIQRLTE